MKLSSNMMHQLRRMKVGDWLSSFEMQTSLATLEALSQRKLVDRKAEPGSMFSPRTGIIFRINDAGIEYRSNQNTDNG